MKNQKSISNSLLKFKTLQVSSEQTQKIKGGLFVGGEKAPEDTSAPGQA